MHKYPKCFFVSMAGWGCGKRGKLAGGAALWLVGSALWLLASGDPIHAQDGIEITAPSTAEILVDSLVAGGNAEVVPGSVNLEGDPRCAGVFSGGLSADFDIDSGIVLSTGMAVDLVGPNSSDFITTSFESPFDAGDDQLGSLVPGAETFDACVLEFALTCPTPGSVQFNYQFASDEYNNFVGFVFTDVFGLFVNDNNAAILPDGVTPVSINTVNGGSEFFDVCANGLDDDGDGAIDLADTDCTASGDNIIGEDHSNPDLFTNNDCSTPDGAAPCPQNNEADGYTDLLTATSPVDAAPEVTTFRLGVTDVADGRLDSWVLVEQGSIECMPDCIDGTYKDTFSMDGSYEGNDGSLMWSGPWMEDDPLGGGAASGHVEVHGGLLTLHDRPDSGTEPGVRRTADLSGAASAQLSFGWLAGNYVDPDDEVTLDISTDGVNWTTLQVFSGIYGFDSGTESIDISAFISPQTTVRFRVTNKYGGFDEVFCVDWIKIVIDCDEVPSECVDGNHKDRFSTDGSFQGNDGSLPWSGPWEEDDPLGGGAASGNVRVHAGFLTLDDYPDSGAEPSAQRTADLSGANSAQLNFGWLAGNYVDPDDEVTLDISTDGVNWTTLRVFTGIYGFDSGTESIDISAFISPQTTVRFRVTNKYGGFDEVFCVDWIEIVVDCDDLCDKKFDGYLSGQGDYERHRLDQTEAGIINGTLNGAPDGDFNLYLYKYDSFEGRWLLVASSEQSGPEEQISYSGSAGRYGWKVVSASGYGEYELCVNTN